MFDKIAKVLKSLSEPDPPVDPASFGDPVALEASWEPLKPGGTNFATRKLVVVSPQRCEFRSTLGAKLFYLVFFVIGLVALTVGIFLFLSDNESIPWFAALIPAIVGTVFTAGGGAMFYFGTRPVVFDRQFGWYHKGRGGAPMAYGDAQAENAARLVDIHALQVIREYVSGDKSSYYSYELNLVLGDGKRLCVTDHGNKTRLREDAQQLAEFLEVPVWDATEG